jgi:hypothetical protein
VLRIVEWSTAAGVNVSKYVADFRLPANASLTVTPGVPKGFESSMSGFPAHFEPAAMHKIHRLRAVTLKKIMPMSVS